MNIKDEQFSNLIKYNDHGQAQYSPEKVALRFAEILAELAKGKWTPLAYRDLWASVPEIGADAKRLDIVKDYSIRERTPNGRGGQVGVVTEVREIRKRDGRTAVEVEIVFYNHTVLNSRDYKRRKLQFIKG
jgi:hypothetical protein